MKDVHAVNVTNSLQYLLNIHADLMMKIQNITMTTYYEDNLHFITNIQQTSELNNLGP